MISEKPLGYLNALPTIHYYYPLSTSMSIDVRWLKPQIERVTEMTVAARAQRVQSLAGLTRFFAAEFDVQVCVVVLRWLVNFAGPAQASLVWPHSCGVCQFCVWRNPNARARCSTGLL